MDHAGNVGAGLVVGRDAVVLIDRSGPRVVGGKGKCDIVVILDEELVEICGAAANVLIWLEAVIHALFGSGFGHELHEAAGTGAADSTGVAVALGLDYAGEQVGIEIVLLAGFGEHFVQIRGIEFRVGL